MDKAIDISIPLRFDGPQPNAYGVEPARSHACEAGEIVGDTRRGGSCNFEQITLIPHCNGTHTECIGHITNTRISLPDCLKDVFIPAMLVTVETVAVGSSNERYPSRQANDRVITRKVLEQCRAGTAPDGSSALIVRTLPNDDRKLAANYGEDNVPPYFTTEAMEYIVKCGFGHLLVDLPSIDRLFDEGKLSNHRIFWSVEPGSFEPNAGSRLNSTITEMIYVRPDVADGEYTLNLQIPPFMSDAAPSRPLLLPRLGRAA